MSADGRHVRFRQYRHHWRTRGGLCWVLGVPAEESGGWDYGGDEEVVGARRGWERMGTDWEGADLMDIRWSCDGLRVLRECYR